MSITEAHIKEAVKVLDQKGPANWRLKVDVDRIQMWDSEFCILGQVYGTYSIGKKALQSAGVWTPRISDAFNEGAELWKIYLRNEKLVPVDLYENALYKSKASGAVYVTHHSFEENGQTYVVYSAEHSTAFAIRTEDSFKLDFTKYSRPVYVDGALYVGKDGEVAIYKALRGDFWGPGFLYPANGTHSSVEYAEQNFAPLKLAHNPLNSGKNLIVSSV